MSFSQPETQLEQTHRGTHKRCSASDKKFDELSSEAKALAIRALQCCLGDHATAETLTPQYGIEVPSDGLVAEAEWAWNEHKKLAKETAKHKEGPSRRARFI